MPRGSPCTSMRSWPQQHEAVRVVTESVMRLAKSIAGALGHHAGVNDQVKDTPPPHAVARLRAACLEHSPTRPRLDRGEPRKERCPGCRLPASHCACALRPSVPTRAGMCLLMSEFEPLKPSNTGWLVADVVPQTQAFTWSRTAVDPALLALLADPQWQPLVVFPGEFARPERVVDELPPFDPD